MCAYFYLSIITLVFFTVCSFATIQRDDFLPKSIDVYSDIATISMPVSGRIIRTNRTGSIVISATFRQRNLEEQEMTIFSSLYDVDLVRNYSQLLASFDISSELLSSYSQSGNRRCVIKEKSFNNRPKFIIEVWEFGRLSLSIDLTTLDLHGPVYTDNLIGSIAWSPNEEYVVYLAERKSPSTSSFYSKSHTNGSSQKPTERRGEEYTFSEDWGEKLNDRKMTDIVVLHVPSQTLRILDEIPNEYCAGQVIFGGDSESVYGVAYDTLPRRLGLAYSNNRAAVVFHLTFAGKFTCISEKGQAPQNPLLSPSGGTLLWLQRAAGWTNGGGSALLKFDVASEKVSVVISLVREGWKIEDGSTFYGIASTDRGIFADENLFIFNSLNGNSMITYVLSLDDGNILAVGNGTLLDVRDKNVLISTSSLIQPPVLYLLSLENKFRRVQVSSSKDLFRPLAPSIYNVEKDNLRYMLLKPSSKSKLPLVVRPHGGIHSNYYNSFDIDTAFFAALGYAVLYVTYRGSLGYGENFVNLLPGHMGDMDVEDTHIAVKHALAKYSDLDKNQIFLHGGSHGGFIALHLLTRYPKFYKAAAVRNPNTEVSIRYMVSDIPDWATVESGLGQFRADHHLTDDEWQKLRALSPLRSTENITAPVIFFVGNNDRRMPNFQSVYMYKVLKARGVKTRLNMYNDNHDLLKVSSHMDALINSAMWFYDSN